jgi:hypothetical protein
LQRQISESRAEWSFGDVLGRYEVQIQGLFQCNGLKKPLITKCTWSQKATNNEIAIAGNIWWSLFQNVTASDFKSIENGATTASVPQMKSCKSRETTRCSTRGRRSCVVRAFFGSRETDFRDRDERRRSGAYGKQRSPRRARKLMPEFNVCERSDDHWHRSDHESKMNHQNGDSSRR